MTQTVLITGGAGYVGSALVPKMLERGYRVRVLDLYLYGDDVLPIHPHLEQIRGDIRDERLLRKVLSGCDMVIHLACISNDPSFELDPKLGRSINLDAFEPLVRIAKESGVRRFIYASSSSVYGVKDVENVTEDMRLTPLTDYSKFKAMCEEILARHASSDFTTVTLRPATVCGYAPRQRLDVVVNILATQAVQRGVIRVYGGPQKRPNIHIADMVDAYILLLAAPASVVAGQTYNVGAENRSVAELADIVRRVVGLDSVRMETVPTNDLRSYHISSEKIARELGFSTKRTIAEAVAELRDALKDGRLRDPLHNPLYYNIKRMQQLRLSREPVAA